VEEIFRVTNGGTPLNPPIRILLCFLGDPQYDRRVQSFIRTFIANGWSVELLYGIPGDALSLKSEVGGASAQKIGLKRSNGPMMFLEYHQKLRQVLTGHPMVDAVMACDLYSMGAASAMKRAGCAKRVFYDAREVYTELPSVANRPLVKAIWWWFEHRSIRNVDMLFVTARHDANAIFRAHALLPASALVRNLPELVDNLEVDSSLRTKLGIAPEKKVLLYVGGLQPKRGIDLMIRAMPGLNVNVVFLIVGEGSERKALEALTLSLRLQDRVKFAGGIRAEDVIRIAASCDVGVTLIEPSGLSYQFALPSKLFEYMMAGLPVLTSKLIHVEELFPNEAWLVTADPLTTDSIQAATRLAIEKSNDPRLRAAARERALSEFHFSAEIAPTLARMEEMILAS
jgi:glycosyltransferase involved in cell wall biosynthesis